MASFFFKIAVIYSSHISLISLQKFEKAVMIAAVGFGI